MAPIKKIGGATIELKTQRFIVVSLIRAQSGRKTLKGHFELQIMYSGLT